MSCGFNMTPPFFQNTLPQENCTKNARNANIMEKKKEEEEGAWDRKAPVEFLDTWL